MNTHSIELDGYYARSRGNSTIYLGTAGSHGNEQLQVTQGKGWEGLTVQVVFHPCKVAVQLPANGVLDVPWEATARPLTAMQGRIVFQGFDQDRLVNSTDLAYSVASHSPALGRDEQPYTPGIVEGVLNQMAADKDAILQAAQQTGQAKEAAAASAAEAASSAANAQQSAGAANTSASQAAGSAAAANETLTQVQTAGQEAQQKVKDAETEALDKIAAAAPALPAVSTDAAWQSVTAKPDGSGYNLAALAPIEASIRPTVSGNPAVCEDSIAWSFQGLKVYGKSTQDGTPSPENPVSIVSAGEGGNIDLDITGSNLIDYFNAVPNGTGAIRYQGNTLYFSRISVSVGGTAIQGGATWVVTLHKGKVFVSASNSAPVRVYTGNVFEVGYASSNRIFSSITASAVLDIPVDGDYTFGLWNDTLNEEQSVTYFNVSYIENQTGIGNYGAPQILTLSTPSGLPGLPVTSGGNYVDSAGQQWVCDVVDLDAGISLRSVGVYKPSETTSGISVTNGGLGADAKTILCRYNTRTNPNPMPFVAISTRTNPNPMPFVAISNFLSDALNNIWTNDSEGYNFAVDGYLDFRLLKSRLASVDLQGIKEFCASIDATFYYALATPITTPLSAEEIAAYRSLQTYPGTTVVSTAEPVAGIEASYVMDGNKYRGSVDKRLAALEAAQTGI